MSSWWRIYAETHGITITNNCSWKKIVALHHSVPTEGVGGSWPKQLLRLVATAGSPGLAATGGGSFAKRIADADDAALQHTGARMLALHGGRAPLT